MTTICLQCGRKDVAVLPCTRWLPVPHVNQHGGPCHASHQCVHEAQNIERIARIWQDDTMWDLDETGRTPTKDYVWPK